ncbi:fluoride efflux transporter CrcB [Saccharospirillum salsuginis]|uniref:Fluoride-specific ion channel FluC n=1 Tax=Saccharospirillum salsuginis TaxID=418750 RepID=A0A918NAG5_9GAMM|nr:fluoride efflux transporter CrcB [Saccharospirillum salsuginis]GGX53168.1 putative fluoride ion transporter CrcB [Saccharospirillum salsuginis]
MSIGLGHWLAVALGGGLGAMGRLWVVHQVNRLQGGHFPWGTLTVNAVGSFIIGLAFVFFAIKHTDLSSGWRSFLIVGVLGAFTTFSSFALESLVLLQEHHYLSAALYMAGSVLICLMAVALGFGAGKLIF